METPYSKLDEMIDQGARALREQSVDTSEMANVLKPRRRSSVILPVGIATAAACAVGALVLLTPSKADAAVEFEKVKRAVQKQPAVYERVLKKTENEKWVCQAETWRDHEKRGMKVAKADGVYVVAFDGKKKYEKAPAERVYSVELEFKGEVANVQAVEGQRLDLVTEGQVFVVDLAWVVEDKQDTSTINEILAKEGMHFLGIKRSQMKDGRQCDVYRVRNGDDVNEMIYYVDPKTDLPFLMEVVGEDGIVKDKIEVAFPYKIKLDVKEGEKGVYEISPIVEGKAKVEGGTFIFTSEAKPMDVPVEIKVADKEKINP